MKQCPNCRRTYADNLTYCLEDGAALVSAFDPDATQVHAPAPLSQQRPTEVYTPPPPTIAYQSPTPTPQPAPAPPVKSRGLFIGAIVVGALIAGLVIGGWLFSRSTDTASFATPSPSPAREATPAITPSPVAKSSPTPAVVMATATPQPGSSATPSPAQVEAPQCVLRNDKADHEGVRVRQHCDTQNCDTDESTIAGEYPDQTPVSVIKGSAVQGKRFTWVKVVILATKQTVWVASTKIKC